MIRGKNEFLKLNPIRYGSWHDKESTSSFKKDWENKPDSGKHLKVLNWRAQASVQLYLSFTHSQGGSVAPVGGSLTQSSHSPQGWCGCHWWHQDNLVWNTNTWTYIEGKSVKPFWMNKWIHKCMLKVKDWSALRSLWKSMDQESKDSS